VLNTFACGPEARTLSRLDPDERRRVVVGEMAARFGARAAQVRDWLENDWSAEEWTRGCFMAHYAPGVLTQLGHLLRRPVGRIHWAGTETATEWCGYMDGAVSSGERVARELGKLL